MIKKIAAFATAGTIAWAGVSAIDNTERDTSGSIVASGELGAFVTQLGDCLNDLPDSSSGAGVSTVTGVPCAEPHHWQVYHKENTYLLEFDPSALEAEGDRICNSATDNLFATTSKDILLQYQNAQGTMLLPTSESWANEDRVVDCLIGSNSYFYTGSILQKSY
jgi:hypothetical protein